MAEARVLALEGMVPPSAPQRAAVPAVCVAAPVSSVSQRTPCLVVSSRGGQAWIVEGDQSLTLDT